MKPPPAEPAARCRWAITVRGVVQGVGFRPFVYNAARSRGLTGWVQNHSGAVHIEVRRSAGRAGRVSRRHSPRPSAPGPHRRRRGAANRLPDACRPGARAGRRSPFAPAWTRPRPSRRFPPTWPPATSAWPKSATRPSGGYRYPFTNCTNCGPRWSIIRQLPYDRPRTSMAPFALCPECAGRIRRSGRPAVSRPADRLSAVRPGAGTARRPADAALAVRAEALDRAGAALLDGRVVAMKGLGGFQLLVDATNADGGGAVAAAQAAARPAVCPDVPLAGRSAAALRTVGRRRPARWLAGGPHPAVAAAASRPGDGVAEAVAPGNPLLGRHAALHAAASLAAGRLSAARSSAPAATFPKSRWRSTRTTPCAAWAAAVTPIAPAMRRGHRRRAPGPRPAHRPPGGRFRGPLRCRGVAGAAPRAGLCPAADRAGRRRADDPGRRRPSEEHRGAGRSVRSRCRSCSARTSAIWTAC